MVAGHILLPGAAVGLAGIDKRDHAQFLARLTQGAVAYAQLTAARAGLGLRPAAAVRVTTDQRLAAGVTLLGPGRADLDRAAGEVRPRKIRRDGDISAYGLVFVLDGRQIHLAEIRHLNADVQVHGITCHNPRTTSAAQPTQEGEQRDRDEPWTPGRHLDSIPGDPPDTEAPRDLVGWRSTL